MFSISAILTAHTHTRPYVGSLVGGRVTYTAAGVFRCRNLLDLRAASSAGAGVCNLLAQAEALPSAKKSEIGTRHGEYSER